MTDTIELRRFVTDEDDPSFVEVARDGATVIARSGRGERATRIEIKALRTEDAAERSLEKRIATLRKNGYLADGVVVRERPTEGTAGKRDAERAALAAKARAAFDAALPTFVRAWRDAGLDPSLDFVAQCVGKRLHPNDVARRCLELAARTFGVVYVRRTTEYDPEHGDVLSVPDRLLADFYRRPAHVLALAHEKLCGRAMRRDDLDAPGLEDEVAARLRTS